MCIPLSPFSPQAVEGGLWSFSLPGLGRGRVPTEIVLGIRRQRRQLNRYDGVLATLDFGHCGDLDRFEAPAGFLPFEGRQLSGPSSLSCGTTSF